MEHGNSAHTTTIVSPGRKNRASKDIRVHYSDGGTGAMCSSNLHKSRENYEITSSAVRVRKAKEILSALILSLSSTQKLDQEQHQQKQYRSFLDDNLNSTNQISTASLDLTPKKSNMKEDSTSVDATCIYRRRPACSIERHSKQPEPNKGITTTATVQTTSMSADVSGSESATPKASQTKISGPAIISPSTSTAAYLDTIMIETEVSNLTESPSSEGSKRVHKTTRFHEGIVTPGDHLLESIARLQEIERKRSLVRDQRFGLEQRLHSFRRVTMLPDTPPEEEEEGDGGGSKQVFNLKYTTCDNRTMLYTGRLDASGQPHDDNALLRFGDEQIYKGGVRNGLRYGTGTNQWPDGQTYSGEWKRDSRNGRGTHIWRDGRTVTGTWKNGHLHGKIYFRWPNGAVFDGSANMGKKEGKGVTTRPDGTVYNGNYSNGKEDGYGTLVRPDGAKYRGDFKNGFKEGHGVMLWPNQTYDGEWSNDRPHGRGKVVWSNGAFFTGQFEEGNYSGMGVYVWPSGKKYVGSWKQGVKHGHGVHTWPSGQTYDGKYFDGSKEGYGRMTWPDGSMYCGGFHKNRKCGRGIQTDASGDVVHCGLWKHDRPCRDGEDPEEVVWVVPTETARPTPPAVIPSTAEEEDGEDENETLALPSLSSWASTITQPGEDELDSSESGIDDPGAEKEDFEDEGIPPSFSKEHPDTSSPTTVAASLHERLTI